MTISKKIRQVGKSYESFGKDKKNSIVSKTFRKSWNILGKINFLDCEKFKKSLKNLGKLKNFLNKKKITKFWIFGSGFFENS